MPLLDMSTIALPDAVEELDTQAARLAVLTYYAGLREVAVEDLDDNDPIVHGLETLAYRETLMRGRTNDATRQTMLSSAFGDGLDDLGADPLYAETPRLELDPGDPGASPPVPPTMETDDDYKARLYLAPATLSPAGPANAYKAHAMAVSGLVVDADVTSPNPCEILVEVLHADPVGTLLTDVATALGGDTVRPVGDRVTVQSATKEASSADITLWVPDGPDLAAMQAASQAQVDALILPLCALVRSGELLSQGADQGLWLGAAMVEGALNVELTASTGMSSPANAWWPMTITVTAQRAA